jgi:hypothetical protein
MIAREAWADRADADAHLGQAAIRRIAAAALSSHSCMEGVAWPSVTAAVRRSHSGSSRKLGDRVPSMPRRTIGEPLDLRRVPGCLVVLPGLEGLRQLGTRLLPFRRGRRLACPRGAGPGRAPRTRPRGSCPSRAGAPSAAVQRALSRHTPCAAAAAAVAGCGGCALSRRSAHLPQGEIGFQQDGEKCSSSKENRSARGQTLLCRSRAQHAGEVCS